MSKYTYEQALAQVRAILDGHMSPDNDGKEPSMPKMDLGSDRLARVVFDTGAALNQQTLDRIKLAKLTAALEECLEYFEERYDVRDGESGPTANREMELGMMIEEALGRRPCSRRAGAIGGAGQNRVMQPMDTFEVLARSILSSPQDEGTLRTLLELRQEAQSALRKLPSDRGVSAEQINAQNQGFFERAAQLLGRERYELLFGAAPGDVTLVDPALSKAAAANPNLKVKA